MGLGGLGAAIWLARRVRRARDPRSVRVRRGERLHADRGAVAPAGVDLGIADWVPGSFYGSGPGNGSALVLSAMLPFDNDFLARLAIFPYVVLMVIALHALARESPARAALLATLIAPTTTAAPVIVQPALVNSLLDPVMYAALAAGLLFLVRHHKHGIRADLGARRRRARPLLRDEVLRLHDGRRDRRRLDRRAARRGRAAGAGGAPGHRPRRDRPRRGWDLDAPQLGRDRQPADAAEDRRARDHGLRRPTRPAAAFLRPDAGELPRPAVGLDRHPGAPVPDRDRAAADRRRGRGRRFRRRPRPPSPDGSGRSPRGSPRRRSPPLCC